MTEPYATPQSAPPGPTDDEVRRRRKFWRRAIWISVAGVLIPPIIGMIRTAVIMADAFGGLSTTGEADPEVLAADISVSLLATMWGLAVSAIAFLVLIAVLIRFFTLPKTSGVSSRNIGAKKVRPSIKGRTQEIGREV